MKTFYEYLAESERIYQYRVKIVGDVDSSVLGELKKKFAQFDVVKMSEPSVSPVQKKPMGFPGFPNQRVTAFDLDTRYPAIEPQIKQLAQLLGIDPNRVIMMTKSYDDSMSAEAAKIKDQNKDLLSDTDLPKPDSEQNSLKKDYSAEPHDHVVLKNAYRSDFTIAGGKTGRAETTNDLPQNNRSPFDNIKRPPKPPTGAQPRG